MAWFAAMFQWPFQREHADAVAGFGFWTSLIALLLTVVGFSITWRQLSQTKSVAQAAKDESVRIRDAFDAYDAAQEVARANYAHRAARKHLDNRAWIDAGQGCEDAMNALNMLRVRYKKLNQDSIVKIDKISKYCSLVCQKIDQNKMDIATTEEMAKMRGTLRSHGQLISGLVVEVEREVSK